MTKLDKDQLEKISGGAEATKTERPNQSIQGARDDSPVIINPVVRPGEADD